MPANKWNSLIKLGTSFKFSSIRTKHPKLGYYLTKKRGHLHQTRPKFRSSTTLAIDEQIQDTHAE